MTKIIAPNKQYTGVSASVSFANGVGETDKPHLIEWFKDHGYELQNDAPPDATKKEDTPKPDATKKEDTSRK